MRTKDSMNHLGDAPRRKRRSRRPNQRLALEFPSVLEAEKNKQRQDDAFKKVTAPAGVVVTRIT
jgi:hypothetical protein